MSLSSLSILAPEAQVVLLTAGGPANDARVRALVESGLDWPMVAWLAESEGAAPAVLQRLRALDGAPVPASAMAQLQRLAMVSEFTMLSLEQRLAEALDALTGAGIEAVLLKGAALVYRAYGSFASRPMSDLDLLVDRRRIEEARAVLLRAGWTWTPSPDVERRYRSHHHLPPLRDGRGTGSNIELHSELFFEGHPFGLLADDVRRSATRLEVGGRTLAVPHSSHLLLHLCLHFAWSHMMRWPAWRTFRDLHVLVDAGIVDWNEFVRMARESRGGTCCYWTLRLGRVVGVAAPAEVEEALQPRRAAFLLRKLEQHFAVNLLPSELGCPSVRLDKALWELGVMPAQSGHGAVRPWDRTADFAHATPEEPVPAAAVGHHLRNVRIWTQYLRTVWE